jgi:putative nucleotidyltransferase with HDIG domain
VKVIRNELADRPNMRSMFQDECALLSRIDHPGVTRVFESGEEAGALYLVMEYIAGLQLDELQLPLPPPLAAKIIADVCRALHAANEASNDRGESLGIVHRDISPRNLMITFDGQMKVLDFGIAFMHQRISRETQAGLIKGRPAYMAPEQFRSERVDRRTDVYSACVVLHELLTGRQLFTGDTLMEIVLSVERGAPPPSELIDGIPPELDDIVLLGLAHERDDRFPNAEALADVLEEVWIDHGAPSLEDFAREALGSTKVEHDDWLASMLIACEKKPPPLPPDPPKETILARALFNGPIVDQIMTEIDRLSEMLKHEPGARQMLSTLRRAVRNDGVQLPMLPEGILRLQKVVGSPSSEIRDLVGALDLDPAVSLRFIAAANSSYYSAGRVPVASLQEAVVRLGIRQTGMVSMAILAQSRVFAASGGGRELYQHALASGAIARLIAEESRGDAQEAFLAGLLHDLGRIVLREAAAQVRRQSRGKEMVSPSALASAERELHSRIGALVAQTSKLSPAVVEAILEQHQPAEGRRLIEIVATSDETARLVVRALGGSRVNVPDPLMRTLEGLGVARPDLLVRRAVESVRALRA